MSQQRLVGHLGRGDSREVRGARSLPRSEPASAPFTLTTALKKTCSSTGTVWAQRTTLGQSAASASSWWRVFSRSMVSPVEPENRTMRNR